jgi:hypothetical protein
MQVLSSNSLAYPCYPVFPHEERMLAAWQFAAVNPCDELKAYLEAALQNVDDIVVWWSVRKVHHLHY